VGIVEEDVARVRESTDMVALVSQYTQLRRVGQRWVGLCPFHAEKSGSFSVNPELGLYHCFGCKASGDAITFLREIEQLDFVGAVETLAGRVGIALRYTDRGGGEERKHREHLHDQVERAVEWYHQRLRTGSDAAAARKYLRQRGFDAEEVAHYRLGWAPRGWDELTRALRLSKDDLEATGLGLLNRRGRLQDFFRGRVLFPILDERGRPIGFGGRKLPDDEGPKYQNSRDNELYHKSRALYGLHWAKADVVASGEVVVCEGYTDVIGFARAGVPRAVATCGTALTEDHVKLLSRFTRRIVLAYDADEAGQSAAERVYAWERAHDLGFWVVELPPGADPDELSQADPEALAAAVEHARPFLEFRVHRTLAAADLDSAEGRARAAEAALEVVAEHPDELVVDQYLMELADETRIEVDRLRERIATIRSGAAGRAGRAPAGTDRPSGDGGSAQPSADWYDETPPRGAGAAASVPDGAEREALRMVVNMPELVTPLEDWCFADPTAKEIFLLLQEHGGASAAAAAAPAHLAAEMAALSVEEVPLEPERVLSQLAAELVRRELVDLEHEARAAPDPLEYSDAIGYLKVMLDDLRELKAEEETVGDLLDWLRLRRQQT
jgi:DNA primase